MHPSLYFPSLSQTFTDEEGGERREFIQPLRKAATSTNGCQGLCFFCHFHLSLFLIVYISYSITFTSILPLPFLSGWIRLSRLTLCTEAHGQAELRIFVFFDVSVKKCALIWLIWHNVLIVCLFLCHVSEGCTFGLSSALLEALIHCQSTFPFTATLLFQPM